MARIVLYCFAILAAAQWTYAHEPADTWPHPHEGEAVARPIKLDRYESLGGEFTLTNQDGRTVRLTDYRGKVVLVFFGYTYCPDACPLTVAKVTQAMQVLGEEREQVRFLFITTDPERDTPRRLKEWLSGFNPEFVGLRGSQQELATIEKRYAAFHIKLPSKSGQGSYQVNHTSRLFLIDQQGVVRYLFTPDQPATSVVEGLRLLLEPKSWWTRLREWSAG